ncbi:MAG: hypothetical protein R3291_04040 [Thermoplasmata archaeon]|nr:hypothetical protein [Thermoplasmata archaeon]
MLFKAEILPDRGDEPMLSRSGLGTLAVIGITAFIAGYLTSPLVTALYAPPTSDEGEVAEGEDVLPLPPEEEETPPTQLPCFSSPRSKCR